ncbi:MAG: B12-binding domain-containing radical SAM protein [Elusimicrobiota bacterium]
MKIYLATPPQPGLMRRRNAQPLVAPVGERAPKRESPSLKRGLLPPLGVAYVAAVLERAGHEVQLRDAPAEEMDFDALAAEAAAMRPGLIGISAMTPTSLHAYRLAEKFKELLPGVPVVLGGAHGVCYPEEILDRCAAIDYVATGEGELTSVDLAAAVAAGGDVARVRGLALRGSDGKPYRTPAADPVLDLDEIPFPARRHLPILRYAPEPYENQRLPSTNIIAARGCTWSRCTFCERSGPMKRKYRAQSPERTIEEIKGLIADYGVRELVFYDDDLMSNQKWIRRFSELLLKEKLDIIWACRAISNMSIRRDTLALAREAGLWELFIGFESGSQELLDNIEKGITIERSLEVARWCRELGVQIIGSFILGLPGETPARGAETIDFAKRLDVDYAAFIPLHPFEGTPLYAQALAEGKLIEQSYDEHMNATRYVPRATYIPEGYGSREAVEAMVRRAYREFYLRPSYFWKHAKRLRGLEDARRYLSGFDFVVNMLR